MAAAARELGIPVDSANRWGATPKFGTALETQRTEEAASIRSELFAQILAQGGVAITCKIALLDAKSETVRHAASSWLLNRILGKNGTPEETGESDAAGEMWSQLARVLHTPVTTEIPEPSQSTNGGGKNGHGA